MVQCLPMTRISLHKRHGRCLWLIGCWFALSGFACPIFCSEQTNIQVSYNDARNQCRDFAETKLSAMSSDSDANTSKTKLVALFSECMKGKGWEVPGPVGGIATADARSSILPTPAPLYNPSRAEPAAGGGNAPYDRDAMQRAADCAWARQNAGSNQIAATRAEACDMECRQRMQANPYGQRAAACGPEYPEDRVHKRMIGNLEGEIPPASGVAEPPQKKVVKKKPKKKPVKKKPAAKPAEKPETPNCNMPSAQTVLDKALADSCPKPQ